MKFSLISAIAASLATVVVANDPIPSSYFTDNGGLQAAEAAAPMWHMPSGTCMPSAAEDGNGNQTNGVLTDNCNINKLNNNCPAQPTWTGPRTPYENIPGEPFQPWVPTYYNVQQCSADNSWRIIYYVYFKKDTGHESDWEGAVVIFNEETEGSGQWIRSSVKLEQDGNHPQTAWADLNDTFNGEADSANYSQKNLNYPKFYFGKFHHSVHDDWYTAAFKNTCPPLSADDYRNDDYYFWSLNNLRSTSYLNPDWNWGKANSPATIDACTY